MNRSLELLRQIGEGGHSVVFLARRHGQHGFQRLVAVKVVRRDSDLPSIVGDRFLHEARLLGDSESPLHPGPFIGHRSA